MQKSIQSLRGEIAAFEQREKASQHELTVEKVKVKKLQEKLTQEREWHEREQKELDKRAKEYQHLKDELSKVQEQFNWDHAENIRQKQQLEELKKELEGLHGGRRAAESEIAQLKAKNEKCRHPNPHLPQKKKKKNRRIGKRSCGKSRNNSMGTTPRIYARSNRSRN